MSQKRKPIQQLLYFVRWRLLLVLLSLPGQVAFVLRGTQGQCGLWDRIKLACHGIRIHLSLDCPHSPLELLTIVEDIVELPQSIEGPIVECGCFRGGSTSKLSVAAAMVGRRLIVCDSFQGLPTPGQADKTTIAEEFHEGDYSAELALVRKTVSHYGILPVVEFVPGWFCDTLHQLSDERIACLFLDVDLKSSIEDCLQALWSRMQPGTRVFVHDVDRPSVVEPFKDGEWWTKNFSEDPPSFFGAGTGLGTGRRLLGYAAKPT